MRKSPAFFTLFLLALAACSTPHIAVDQGLAPHAVVLPVKGRQGWQLNQSLTLGDYRTGKVNRGWTKRYDYPFIVRFSGAKERLEFDLFDPAGKPTRVMALGKLAEQDLTLLHEFFDINLRAKDLFSGAVVVGDSVAFDFYLANLNQNNWFREARGEIKGWDVTAEIRPIQKLDTGKTWLAQQAPGFEFVVDGMVVGAVETLNEGRVWLRKDMREDLKTVFTAVSAALLLREELIEV